MDYMHYFEVAPTQIIRADSTVLTYSCKDSLNPGHIVLIEVGRKKIIGIVLREVNKPPYKTKDILVTVEVTPLPYPLIQLAEWMSEYYATHLALVFQSILPRGLTKSRREKKSTGVSGAKVGTKILLNHSQQAALDTFKTMSPGTLLLHGVTGSGKTAVYAEAAKRTLESGKSTIVLIPEIALTTQVVNYFSEQFENIIVTHSRQSEATRHAAWQDALTTTKPRVIIGPRSALFLPLDNVGLIIIDEAHEPSYKQEQSPRYSALRAASVLASRHQAKLILGSATPSVSDYFIAKNSNRSIVEMKETARPSKAPAITLIDMTRHSHFSRHRFFSNELLDAIQKNLTEKSQVLIFHNRRGSTSMTVCEQCGWQASCKRCFIPLSLHSDTHNLRCHVCGHTETIPTSCPLCNHANIIHKGVGTKLIESELTKLFPKANIARFDGDSENGNTLDARYNDLYDGEIDIIIGTQVVAKGLDLPRLRTVGVVQADSGLSMPDFSTTERTFQLLAQVVGRVGRSDHTTSVIVQTYHPNHFAIVNGLTQNYNDFYENVITERKRAHFPPFVFLLKITCIYKTEAAAIRNASSFAQTIRDAFPTEVEVLGPTPAFYERQRGTYRWQLVIKSKKRSTLTEVLSHLPSSHWQFELDPVSLL